MSEESSSWAEPITMGGTDRAAQEWPYFCNSIYCVESDSLGQRIVLFAKFFAESVRKIEGCENFDDDTIIGFVVLGIEKSGTHSFEEIEVALGISWSEGKPCFPKFSLVRENGAGQR